MSRIMSSVCRCRCALLPVLLLPALVFASTARAGTITYNILPNPQADTTANGGTDNVSGTITFSSSGSVNGTFNSSNDSGVTVASTLTVTNSNGTVVTMGGSEPLSTALGSGSIQLGATSLIVNSSTQFELYNSAAPDNSLVEIDWAPSNDEYQGDADAIAFNGITLAFQNFDPGQYLVGGNWTIATVPEPSSVAIALMALAGIAFVGAFARRRNRFAAGCDAHGSA
jgi:hypothetical protein